MQPLTIVLHRHPFFTICIWTDFLSIQVNTVIVCFQQPIERDRHYLVFILRLRVLNSSIIYRVRVIYFEPFMDRLRSLVFVGVAILVIAIPFQSLDYPPLFTPTPKRPIHKYRDKYYIPGFGRIAQKPHAKVWGFI